MSFIPGYVSGSLILTTLREELLYLFPSGLEGPTQGHMDS